ncbi:hypothetical protein [Flexibacterium corallicola]|uniref:hypothetical protein n=1 Tax=Flexibacterium corallicola TaxID=3037259 RepID=UPI00286EF400|nr:hypothetical protein [Pseudovibrio sp. M1P-2-3]
MVTRERYLWTVHILVRSDGERLPMVLDANGVPAHYPTCLILSKRAKHLAYSTLYGYPTAR